MRDPSGFDDFYRSTAARMVRFAFAITGNLAEAQDVVQEGYIRAWRRWRTVSAHPAPESWVRLVVSRLATDRWRRMNTLRAALRRTDAPRAVNPPGEDTVLLTNGLRQLPQDQRVALAMHYLYDMSIEEIAAERGVAIGTVKSWLSRGRTRLAAVLSDEAPATLEVHDVR